MLNFQQTPYFFTGAATASSPGNVFFPPTRHLERSLTQRARMRPEERVAPAFETPLKNAGGIAKKRERTYANTRMNRERAYLNAHVAFGFRNGGPEVHSRFPFLVSTFALICASRFPFVLICASRFPFLIPPSFVPRVSRSSSFVLRVSHFSFRPHSCLAFPVRPSCFPFLIPCP